ncbi:MAG: glycosyltransferase family 2 protein [Chitinophagales bacterium]|nr:glycosyltransferase family 2 protein [Chitinophagales bacterium]
MLPSVAIVILNYNGLNFLQQFLPSVIASTYANKKIIVADNASTDNSIQWLKENYPNIHLLLSTENRGYAGGYNWALKNIEADYYALLNSDIEVQPNWIEPIITLMEVDKTIAACQPKILSWKNKTAFEYAGACGGYIDCLGYPFSRGRLFDVCETDEGQYNTVQKIFWATGAALFIRSKIFHQLNGFDEYFFAHMEEIDLCWRMQLAGYSIAVEPSSIVYHVGGGTLPKGYRKTYLNFRNNLIMLCKNLTTAEKVFTFPLRCVLDFITAGKALISVDFDMFKAIIDAHIALIKWKFFVKKKNTVQPKSLKHLQGVYNGSVVWEYFIKKKKKFSAIMKY